MFSKSLIAFLLVVPCAALNLKDNVVAKPPDLIQNQDTCTLTFAAHSGFANQLWGALGAGYIAKVTGCKLVLPPVLNHGDTSYGKPNECQKGVKFEKMTLAKAAPWYRQSNLTWDQIYNIKPQYASLTRLPKNVDPRSLYFLPLHCTLWKEMGENEEKFAEHLKAFIQKTDPVGSYTIGSGFNTGAPRLQFNELFDGISANLEQAVSDTQDGIAKLGKAKKGDYACVHLRSRDIFLTNIMEDKPLRNWVKNNLANIGSQPLYVMSANLHENVENVMQDICSKQETECIDSASVMPKGAYGLTQGSRLKDNRKLLIELATCSMASNLYLPGADKKIVKGEETVAKEPQVFQSTLSELVADMAKNKRTSKFSMDKTDAPKKRKLEVSMQAANTVNALDLPRPTDLTAKQKEEALALRKSQAEMYDMSQERLLSDTLEFEKMPKSDLAKVYVTNVETRHTYCECMATQLADSPYEVEIVKAENSMTLTATNCPKNGTVVADPSERAKKCTYTRAVDTANEYAKRHPETKFSIFLADDTIILRKGFWQKVHAYLEQADCQDWDYTVVDAAYGDIMMIGAQDIHSPQCSYGETKGPSESLYEPKGKSSHFHIVRNSHLPHMHRYLHRETKRDLSMMKLIKPDVLNYFCNKTVGWYPRISASLGTQYHQMKMTKYWRGQTIMEKCSELWHKRSGRNTGHPDFFSEQPKAFTCAVPLKHKRATLVDGSEESEEKTEAASPSDRMQEAVKERTHHVVSSWVSKRKQAQAAAARAKAGQIHKAALKQGEAHKAALEQTIDK